MSTTESASFWDDKYRNNEASWDMKTPTPVFENLLDAQQFVRPGKILIVGSGKGYDAVLAAKKGYEVFAVDFSTEAIEFSKNLAEKENLKLNYLLQDIFQLDSVYRNHFDYVYDYVTYCSILPERRKEYSEKISVLLKTGGKLIALLFPVEDRKGGPPYAVDVLEFYDLFSQHLQLKFSSWKINSIKPRRGREVLQIYLKKAAR
jgi:SAM-dependent methyltransferase